MAELTIQQAFEIANRQYQSGQVHDAESLYRQILGFQPNHIPSMQMLAQLSLQTGRAGDAEELLRRALSLNPQDADAHNNLGMVLATGGRLEEAVNSFGRALMLRPAFPTAYNNLGNTLRSLGQLSQAIRAYQKALSLQPNYADARDNLNDALKEQAHREQMQAAAAPAASEPMIEVPDEMLAGIEPSPLPPAASAEPAAAEESLEPMAIEAEPPVEPVSQEVHEEEHAEPAAAAQAEPLPAEPEASPVAEVMEHFELAADATEPAESETEAVSPEETTASESQLDAPEPPQEELLKPEEPETVPVEPEAAPVASATEAEAEPLESTELPEPELSPEPAESAVEPPPAEVEVIAEVGELQLAQAAPAPDAGEHEDLLPVEPEESEAPPAPEPPQVEEPAELVPRTTKEFQQRGRSRWSEGRYDEAAADFHAALDVDPSDAEARTDLGLILLSQGDFRGGWPAYEAKLAESAPLSPLPQPQWDGSDLANHRILLRAEQSAADAIQFIRYAPLVGRRGGRVIVRCLPELRNLLVDQPGILLLVSTSDPMPKFYTHCPLSSLPRVMGTTPDSIPADVPYLLPDGKLVDKWYARISAEPAGLKVGLALRASSNPSPTEKSSPPASELAALDQVSGVRFYALQPSAQPEDPAVPDGLNVTDWTGELRDLAQTAALISCLDLVITTDNVVAHLAGALGRPTLLLLPSVADWRWLIGRGDSPWYPTMQLFRQPERGNWDLPAQQVIAELRRRAQEQ